MIKGFISSLTITAIMLMTAWLVSPFMDDIPAGFVQLQHYVVYPVLLTVMLLSLLFNQNRLFYLLYLSGLFFLMIHGDVTLPVHFENVDKFIFIQLAFLVFLSAAIVLLYLKEKGVLSIRGLLRFFLITSLPLIPLFLAMEQMSPYASWMSMGVFPHEISQILPLPDITVALYILAISIVLLRLLYRAELLEGCYFSLLTGAAIALYSFPVIARVDFIFFMSILTVMVLIIRNSFYLAYRDELTGLAGRRSLRDQMSKLGKQYSLAMIDIDHFKKFNDRYGHDAGDQVLKMVAAKIDKTGAGSKAYRYGGEEFTLVFSGKKVSDTMAALERLRIAIAETAFIIRGKKRKSTKTRSTRQGLNNKNAGTKKTVKVQVSIGVADSTKEDKNTKEVLKLADKALYRAKRKGRNQVSK